MRKILHLGVFALAVVLPAASFGQRPGGAADAAVRQGERSKAYAQKQRDESAARDFGRNLNRALERGERVRVEPGDQTSIPKLRSVTGSSRNSGRCPCCGR